MSLEEIVKLRLELWEKALGGDCNALMKVSFGRGLISQEDLEDYHVIDRTCQACDEEGY